MNTTRKLLLVVSAGTALLAAAAASADTVISGFGTLGYAQSDQPYRFQRFIDEDGTFKRDSLLALQLDSQIAPAWGLTLQSKLAPSPKSDSGWKGTLTWAFLSYRPSNDLLLRAGKLRVPLMLNAENTDVGTTFDFARLPTEVYSLSPVTDFNGVYLSKTWFDGDNEWTADAYVGDAQARWRFHGRENTPSTRAPGPWFAAIDLRSGGVVATLRREDNTFRAGFHQGRAKSEGHTITDFPFVSLAPGIGFYQVMGPGVPTTDRIPISVLTLGADMALPDNFRVIGEFARRRVSDVVTGLDSRGAYAALLKRIGPWVPYVYHAQIKSSDRALNTYRALNSTRVPALFPLADLINASQRVAADSLGVYDQTSWALGTSYSLTPGRKLKAEWLRTRVGEASSFIDAPPGESSGGRHVNVLSLSYSFTF